jgi:parvulin-like peptidyl-prolyl isomerase
MLPSPRPRRPRRASAPPDPAPRPEPAARRPGRAAGIVLALLASPAFHTACGRGEGGRPAGGDVIAEIGGEPISRPQFDAYLEEALPAAGAEGSEEPTPELLSRLLDRFLDEELVLREARLKGVAVSEREVTDALRRVMAQDETRAGNGRDAQEAERERMRRALLARKFREEVVLKDLTVSDEEVAAHYETHRDQFQQAARLVLRQILLDDPEQARAVHQELTLDPARFQEVAEARSLAPDGGRPRAYEEADLPEEIVAATRSVPEGGLSEVVTTQDASRIFLVEKRQPERVVGIEEARDRIRVSLLQEKSREAYETYLDSLRRSAGLVVHEEKLPFGYRRRSS